MTHQRGPSPSHFMDRTRVVLSHSFFQDAKVDLEPLLLALAGLCALRPVVFVKLILHPFLFGNLHPVVAVVVVDYIVVQQPHGRELVDAGEFDGFGEGRVDVSEGMSLWKSHMQKDKEEKIGGLRDEEDENQFIAHPNIWRSKIQKHLGLIRLVFQ